MTVLSETTDDLTLDEIIKAAEETRNLLSKTIGIEVPDSTYVTYEKRTVAVKLGGQWWMMIHGEEAPTSQASITLLPFTSFFRHCNDTLAAIAKVEGEGAAMKILAECGVDVEFVSGDDTNGDHSPTLN